MLRVNPIAVEIPRVPIEQDILPLSKPIVGTSGRVYTELPIPKGTTVNISTIGYNWCTPLTPPPPGQCAYLGAFWAGTRICGVQTLTNSDRSGGLGWTNRLNHPLGCMGTCTVTYEDPMGPSGIDI